MYGCESWTTKKAKCRRTDAFELWCWRKLLRVPWTARRSNQFSREPAREIPPMTRRPDKASGLEGLSGPVPPMTRPCGETWWARRIRTRGTPWTCSSIYPKTRICLSYYFVPFTNSSDINRGLLAPTTFLWKKVNLGLLLISLLHITPLLTF